MRAGHIMDRSPILFYYNFNFNPNSIRTLLVILSLCIFSTTLKASQLRVALSTSLSTSSSTSPSPLASTTGMVVEQVQSGLKSELSRQGYVTGANLSWAVNSKAQSSDVKMTISMAQNTPFITLLSQQGLSTNIYINEIENTDLSERYQVNVIKKLLPDINALGVILDRHVTDISHIEQFLLEQREKGVRIIYSYVDDSTELRATTRLLAPQVDAIYLPRHITDMPELAQVVTVAERNDVALIGEDHRSIDKGIFAVYNIDYVQVGRDTADLLVRLAESKGDSHTERYLAHPVLSINLDAASRIGVEFSSDVINTANYIIE